MNSENEPTICSNESTSSDLRGLYVKTFGCQMNEYDSEKVLALLGDEYQSVDSAEDAKVVFVNTCSVREKAAEKLFSLLGRLRLIKEKRPELIIGVGGCVAQQEGEAIIKRNQAVDFVVGTHNISLVPSLVRSARQGLRRQVAIDYRDEWEDLPDAFLPSEGEVAPHSQVRALVSIQRGCNKNCTYCVVPRTRGLEVSRALNEIEREVRLKVGLGAKEVLLLGQTVNSYGKDLSPRVSFAKLIKTLAEIEGLERIRFTSPHPADVKEDFIELYADFPQLCRHIHLPLQSGNDRILKLMNRNYRVDRYLKIVDSLRKACPDIAISSDIIVGFPTETDEEFRDTLEVMKEVQYHTSFSFCYSERPMTKAKELYSGAELVPLEVSKARLAELQAIQSNLSYRINQSTVGKTVEVLVENIDKQISSLARGRIAENTLIELTGGKIEPGTLVNARVEHASPHGLRGSLIETSK